MARVLNSQSPYKVLFGEHVCSKWWFQAEFVKRLTHIKERERTRPDCKELNKTKKN